MNKPIEKKFYSQNFERYLFISIGVRDVSFYFQDDTIDFCFYDFLSDAYHVHFKIHMKDKCWFTQDMSDFITKNIQPC